MKLPTGNIHLLRLGGGVQNGKLLIQLAGMAGVNSGLRSGHEELLDPFMPKAANHTACSVPRNVTLRKRKYKIFTALRFGRERGTRVAT